MDPSRRAFLGAGSIALATPWWVGWVGKFFGPSGHIHDTKVRGYAPETLTGIDLGYGESSAVTFRGPGAWTGTSDPNLVALKADIGQLFIRLDAKYSGVYVNTAPTEWQLMKAYADAAQARILA